MADHDAVGVGAGAQGEGGQVQRLIGLAMVGIAQLQQVVRLAGQLGRVVIQQNLRKAGDRAQRRAQVMRYRVAERFEFSV